jgi:Raf kinase inhibitor-like YbhB/YbcL family protein
MDSIEPGEREGQPTLSIRITSNAFDAGQRIPTKFTGDGDDVSPALAWSGVPAGAKVLALIVDDPDAPRAEPWVHWLLYKLPPTTGGLPEGVPTDKKLAHLGDALQGRNDFKKIGYGGPAPPTGHGVHNYRFHLYALYHALQLEPGLDKKPLITAMSGHILDEGVLVGTYER